MCNCCVCRYPTVAPDMLSQTAPSQSLSVFWAWMRCPKRTSSCAIGSISCLSGRFCSKTRKNNILRSMALSRLYCSSRMLELNANRHQIRISAVWSLLKSDTIVCCENRCVCQLLQIVCADVCRDVSNLWHPLQTLVLRQPRIMYVQKARMQTRMQLKAAACLPPN